MSLRDIIKTDNIIIIHPHETLASALSKLSTSHDAAFLFDEEKKFLGVINPYNSLIKSSFPGNAKVEHCVYHPPKLKVNFSISKIAELFIQSKIHYLPVFDDLDRFQGIISARHLLSKFRNLSIFNIKISDILKSKNIPLATIGEEDTVQTAVALFKKTRYSKLIVVGKDLKLRGILSYYDIVSYLVSPKEKSQKGEREGNKISFYHNKIKMYSKSYVLTLTPNNFLNDVVHFILDKKIGSVVIIDANRHPVGIITTKDLLRFFIQDEKGKKIEIMTKNLSLQSRHIFGGFFNYLNSWIGKKQDVSKARIIVKEEKQGGLFKVILSLIPKKGTPTVIKEEGKNLVRVLQRVKKD